MSIVEAFEQLTGPELVALAERCGAYPGVLAARAQQAEQDRTRNMRPGAVEVSAEQMLALMDEGR